MTIAIRSKSTLPIITEIYFYYLEEKRPSIFLFIKKISDCFKIETFKRIFHRHKIDDF